MIAVLDATRMKEAGTTLIDLNETATRRVYGIEPGSKEEGAAVAAAEVLIDADEVQDGLLIGGLLDVAWLRERQRPQGVAKTVEVLTDEDKGWLAQMLYRYHALSEAWRRCGWKSRELTLVTDASVQTPDCGAMAGYVMALEAAKAAAAAEKAAAEPTEEGLRWAWDQTGWALQANEGEAGWRWVTLRGARVQQGEASEATRHATQVELAERAQSAVHEPAERARRGGAPRRSLTMRLASLCPPPVERLDAAGFVAARLRELAEARAHTGTRLWHARLEEARGPRLKAAEWVVAENLRNSDAQTADVTEATYRAAVAVHVLQQERPWAWALLRGTVAQAACGCVGGETCRLRQPLSLDYVQYQAGVDARAGFVQGSWRRVSGAGAAPSTVDETAQEEDEADTAKYCLCGARCATLLERGLHWELAEGDGRDHGLPPDERKRVGVAWLLLDEATGYVLRAGCERMPATGEADDYSTKSEGQAVRAGLHDVLPGLPSGWSLRIQTDSAGWVASYESQQSGQVKLRRTVRKPDTGSLHALLSELETAAGRGVRISAAEWQPAEHNLPAGDDRRLHAISRANRAVDAGAGRSAEAGRGRELDFFATHQPPPDADAAFFSHGGAPVTGDVRPRVQRAVGLKAAARAVAGPMGEGKLPACTAAGTALRMARRGDVDVKATVAAYKGTGPAAQGVVLRARLGRTRSSGSELLRRQRSAETERLRRVLAVTGTEDRRCVCGTGAIETRAHWRTGCELSAGAMNGVARATSGALAALGCAFWFDVQRRVGHWQPAGGARSEGDGKVLERAGGPGDGYTPLVPAEPRGRVRLWGGGGEKDTAAAVLTWERLACLAAWWQGGDAAAMREAVGVMLRACLVAAPRARRARRVRRQDSWQPGEAKEAAVGMGAEVAEAAGEAAKMRAGLPASAAAWLAGMHDAERDALRPDTHDDADDEVRLTASAHALGLEPGANLEQSDVHARYVALSQQLHACREVGEASTEA
mgnify:CR=1 FL=1